jgi:hypothetical protein
VLSAASIDPKSEKDVMSAMDAWKQVFDLNLIGALCRAQRESQKRKVSSRFIGRSGFK